MYNIGICDDGNNTCAFIESAILQYVEKKNIQVEIFVWYSGEALCEYLKRENILDILYLDIELIEVSGIAVGEFIRNELEDRKMQIVYISAKQSYAQQLFKTQPMDFLVKPITGKQIEESLELAMKIIGRVSKNFKFQYGKDFYYLPYEEIIYFVSGGRKIKIITTQGEREFYGKMKEVIKQLSEDFIMIHQSYIVNRMHITQYTYEMVQLDTGITLNISQVRRKEVRDKLLKEV